MPDWIVDGADVLTAEEESALTERLLDFYERTTVELVGVTVEHSQGQTVAAYTSDLFNQWDLGSRQTNNGVVVLLALKERQVHITRGAGIALQLPQNRLNSITDSMAERFRRGRIWCWL